MNKQPLRYLLWPSYLLALAASAQVASQNVNMVSGTTWPKGDPFLQRQNEPSLAVSSRNSSHLLAGANDYRTVDLPGLANDQSQKETGGDAWLGIFKSFDNGDTWQSDLIPGYPQDQSIAGVTSPIHGMQAGADPIVRPGTNGMLYYSGMAFSRAPNAPNKIFVARFIDDNNIEAGDPIRYLDTQLVATSANGDFFDKPSLAVDKPRPGAATCSVAKPAAPPPSNQLGAVKYDDSSAYRFPAGLAYIAYTRFAGGESSKDARIVLSNSSDCGHTWSAGREISTPGFTSQGAAIVIDINSGTVFVFWRQFGAPAGMSGPDAIMMAMSMDCGATFGPPTLVARINPFEEGTAPTVFRSNAYPTATEDGNGRLYVAWSDRSGPNGAGRILITSTLATALNWTAPVQADPDTTPANPANPGHQLMPALSLTGSKLTLAYYDLRQDHEVELFSLESGSGGVFMETLQSQTDIAPFFTPAIDDAGLNRRHTMDIRVAQAQAGSILQNTVAFAPSILVSQYSFGALEASGVDPDMVQIQQLEFNPPNLPMFKTGTEPFMGDYIDVAGPIFVPNPDGSWSYNTTDSTIAHVVWTDNRDVVAPPDGNWTNYTPVSLSPAGAPSTFDPTQSRPACTPSTTGSRNQNIYTSRITPGVSVQTLGTFKQLGAIQRGFPVTIQNATNITRSFTMAITQQPPGGAASFIQDSPVPVVSLMVNVAPFSSSSRTVFASSTNPMAAIPVAVAETGTNAVLSTTTVLLNGDSTNATILNPNIPNPNIPNPNIPNFNIANVEIYNPNIPNAVLTTPDFSNPNIPNPNIPNPNIPNPNIPNPNIPNPNIPNYVLATPNIPNPNIPNPNIPNPNIPNPNIPNPNIPNPNIPNVTVASASLSDTTWTMTNNGNTTSAFTIKLMPQANSSPGNVNIQMIAWKPYLVPALGVSSQGLINCQLTQRLVLEPLLNIPNVADVEGLILDPNNPEFDPDLLDPDAPTLALAPGELAYITMRVFNPTPNAPVNAATLFTPVAISHGGNTGSNTYSLSLLRVVTMMLPNGQLNLPYLATIFASGGAGAYNFSAAGLPSGLFINPSNGTVSGVPTAGGTYAVSVTVKDSNNPPAAYTQLLNLAILGGGIAISTNPNLPNGQVGVAYNSALSATGGASAYQWSVTAGTLPPGLSLSSAGALSGTPTAAGNYSFAVQVRDTAGAIGSVALTMTITPPPLAIATPATLPNAVLGASYSQTLTATGGSGQYTWMLTAGSLPSGLTLDSRGDLTGTPTAAAGYQFTVQVNDGASTVSRTFSVLVSGIIVTTNSLPIGIQGLPYTVTVLQGAGGNTWTSTQLPAGLSLNPQGLLYGIPQAAGTTKVIFTFTNGGATATTELPLTVQGNASTAESAVTMTIRSAQELVATPGQQLSFNVDFTLQPSSTVDQLPVGFLGQTPQLCLFDGSSRILVMNNGATFNLTAPATPGRYYVVYGHTTNATCQLNSGYGFTGGPEQVIALVDVIPSTVSYGGSQISDVNVNSTATNYALVSPNQSVPLSFNAANAGELQFGVTGQLPDSCVDGGFNAAVKPVLPGRYYIGFDAANASAACTTATWFTNAPDVTRAIAVLDVAISY